ncbi:unnamed protein product [Gongylonema pulchrum]|uniref:PITH domain-containing protein n=1 Tax=Gongylonema pulchrum TaxID=637853 RepID=A0A183DY62_9BILA|nr:unnamed protein product [Gongylonema pulchrum]
MCCKKDKARKPIIKTDGTQPSSKVKHHFIEQEEDSFARKVPIKREAGRSAEIRAKVPVNCERDDYKTFKNIELPFSSEAEIGTLTANVRYMALCDHNGYTSSFTVVGNDVQALHAGPMASAFSYFSYKKSWSARQETDEPDHPDSSVAQSRNEVSHEFDAVRGRKHD